MSTTPPPQKKTDNFAKPTPPESSPHELKPPQHPKRFFSIPSPVPCRRTRTISASRMVSESELQHGTVESFCREKGHGFVKPDHEERHIFLHISDIEDEHVVQAGDRVQYRTIPMPPKCVEKMAVEVRISEVDHNKPHERWDKQPDVY